MFYEPNLFTFLIERQKKIAQKTGKMTACFSVWLFDDKFWIHQTIWKLQITWEESNRLDEQKKKTN